MRIFVRKYKTKPPFRMKKMLPILLTAVLAVACQALADLLEAVRFPNCTPQTSYIESMAPAFTPK